ncbi:MAG: glycosyltransferase [Alphaproteobacteria bacterium]|nr:glycosyltransferase [Alphaproteobacteria bacterium]
MAEPDLKDADASAPCIVQIVPALDAGGVERTAVDVAIAVAKRGWRSILVTTGGRLEDEARAQDVEILRLNVASKNPITILANGFALASFLKSQNVSLVHARSRAPGWSALIACTRAGVPLITTYAGIHSADLPGKRLYNSIMARGERVIANSQYTADHVAAAHATPAERLRVIHRGIDLSAFDEGAMNPDRVDAMRAAWGARHDQRVVLLPGRLTRWKGQHVLIEAAAAMAKAGDTSSLFVLAGDEGSHSHYVGELDKAIAAAGLTGRVKRVGHITDMPAAYMAADVVLSTSVKPEAFGRIAVEAQAMGRPIIATDLGAARETVKRGETGFLVKAGDATALAQAIRAALALDPETRETMASAARGHAKSTFSVAAMCTATLALYDEILGRDPR